MTPSSILVYISSNPDNAIGEHLIKMPFMLALREAFPDARITWVPGLGKGVFEGPLTPLLGHLVDEVITDLDLKNTLAAAILGGNPLPGRRFDLIIDTQRAPLRTLQLRKIPHDRFISAAWNWMLSDDKPPADLRNRRRLVMQMLALSAAACGRTIMPPPQVPLAEGYRTAAAALLPDGPTYIGLAPGAGNQVNGKLWPLESYIAVARQQSTAGRVPVFILGPSEAGWMTDIQAAVPTALFPLQDDTTPADWRGIPLTIALGQRMAVSVANCSGVGHMLGLGGRAMVSLFGPTNPAKYLPYAAHAEAVRAQDFQADPKVSLDMTLIPVTAVCNAIERCLTDATAPQAR